MDLYDTFKQLPPVELLRRRRFENEFRESHDNLFRGDYENFAEATRHIPDTKPVGYDNPEPAMMYREVMSSLRSYDYPVLYWLNRTGYEPRTILDYGGHVGVLYYGINRLQPLPEGTRWIVFDVPTVVETGAELAREKDAVQLEFTATLENLDDIDVFLASGSLQYVEKSLVEVLGELGKKPKHMILNMIPLHPLRQFITINAMDVVYCPYKISHLDAFLTDMSESGYRVRDQWVNDNKQCHIPFVPEAVGIQYYGMYLSLGN